MDSGTIRTTLDIWSVARNLMRAYVFIDSTKKAAGRIAAELQKQPRVLTADVINGPHPVIACVQADSSALMAQTVLFDIRKIEGVKDLTVFMSTDGQDDGNNGAALPDVLLPDFSKSSIGETVGRKRKRSRKTDVE